MQPDASDWLLVAQNYLFPICLGLLLHTARHCTAGTSSGHTAALQLCTGSTLRFQLPSPNASCRVEGLQGTVLHAYYG